MTWRDLIRRTLEDLGVYGQAQIPTANDESTALDRLNDWIDALKNDNLSLYRRQRTTWALTGVASYDVSLGGTIAVARPPSAKFIDGFGYVDQNVNPDFEYPLGPPITYQEYRGTTLKAQTSEVPQGFYYEQGFPSGRVYPLPIPTGANLLGVMYSGVPVEEVPVDDITDSISLPPGYRRFIRLGLQIEAAPAFRVKVAEDVPGLFIQAKSEIERTNEDVPDEMGFGVAGRLFQGYDRANSNIYTGET